MFYDPTPTLIRPLPSFSCLLFIAVCGAAMLDNPLSVNLLARHPPPDAMYWFGIDNLGRDLWIRCSQGVLTSLQIGIGAALCSGSIALMIVAVSRIHPRLDVFMCLTTDAMLSMPHLLLSILIYFTLGGGKNGVTMAVVLTHWSHLALILCAEAWCVAHSDYLTLTWRLGHGYFYRWRHHYLPVLLSQWLTGTSPVFPHAALHSATLSFLGSGLAPYELPPGLLPMDALKFISHGDWWLVLFSGLMLFSLVMLFDQLARAVHHLWLRGDACRV